MLTLVLTDISIQQRLEYELKQQEMNSRQHSERITKDETQLQEAIAKNASLREQFARLERDHKVLYIIVEQSMKCG